MNTLSMFLNQNFLSKASRFKMFIRLHEEKREGEYIFMK